MRQKLILGLLVVLYIGGTVIRTGHELHPWEFLWCAWVLCRDFIVGCFAWILHGVMKGKYDSQNK